MRSAVAGHVLCTLDYLHISLYLLLTEVCQAFLER